MLKEKKRYQDINILQIYLWTLPKNLFEPLLNKST